MWLITQCLINNNGYNKTPLYENIKYGVSENSLYIVFFFLVLLCQKC